VAELGRIDKSIHSLTHAQGARSRIETKSNCWAFYRIGRTATPVDKNRPPGVPARYKLCSECQTFVQLLLVPQMMPRPLVPT
jgi:hypothetical protein